MCFRTQEIQMTLACGHEYSCLIWGCMDWDDEYDIGYDDMAYDSHRDNGMPGKEPIGDLDP